MQKTTYTNPTLREFERSLNGFREGKFNAVNVYKYLCAKNIGTMSGKDFSLYESKIAEYEDVLEKLRQLSHLQNRTKLAKGHEAAALAEMK